MSSTPPPLAAALGRFAACQRAEELPSDVIDALRFRVLDLLAASCSGVLSGNPMRLLSLLPGDGPVGIVGTAATRSLRDAALVNSAVAHSTYYEDGSRHTGGHPSSALIPAAMALAQVRGASGGALLAAIAVGYEVFLRLGHALYPSTVRRGFQSTAILAAPATAAAASVLLGLSPERAAHAIAIACSHGAGLKEALKSADSQPLQVGRSSEGGLLSALFAEQGACGAAAAVEHFLSGFADGAQAAPVADGLGDHWHIDETYLKAHGGCRGNHAPVDAAAALARAHGVTPSQIVRIDVQVDSVTLAAAIDPPRDAAQAQFSIGFSIAAVLVAGDLTPARFSDSTLADPAVRDLMARTTIEADPFLDDGYPQRRPAIVTFTLTDGRVLRERLDHARGEPENPMRQADVEHKFDTVAGAIFGLATTHIRELVLSLDTLPTLDPLATLLATPADVLSSHRP